MNQFFAYILVCICAHSAFAVDYMKGNSMKKAVVLRHVAFENLGNLAAVLEFKNYEIEYIEVPTASLAQYNPLDADLLIILGGPIGVYEGDMYPFLTDEIAFIKARLEKRLPTLGICLGAQLIAWALGARVYPGHQKEIGWSGLQLSAAGHNSFMHHLDESLTTVLHWHGDTFDLPAGAQLLASSTLYPNQAFMVDDSILALQFHPELLPGTIESWLVGHTCELNKAGIDINQLRTISHASVNQLNAQARKFWDEWIELVTFNFNAVQSNMQSQMQQ